MKRIGKKMAGVKLSILSLVNPIMFKPKPIKRIEPTQMISVITAVDKSGSNTKAKSVILPWIIRTGTLDSKTPAPKEEAKRIDVIPSRILLVKSVVLSPVSPLSNEPKIAIEPTQKINHALINPCPKFLI